MTQLLGTSTINGLHVGHTEIEVAALLDFIRTRKIKKFIEIGVHVGGLTNILIKIPNLKYMGIEINPSIVDASLRNSGVFFVFGDCFTVDVMQKAQMFIQAISGTSLVYCDGGNKAQELQFYYKILAVGDYIFAHDYYDKMRMLNDLLGFGIDLEFPKPEVWEKDIQFLRDNPNFREIRSSLEKTRICGFKRIK